MILLKYLLKRFFKYLFLINSLLVLLFNSIDFFEKFIRIKEVQTIDILKTILLSLLPSFFEYLPLSCWLATVLLIRELNQQNEWDIFPILNIKTQKILLLFFMATSVLAIFSFLGNEEIAHPLSYKAEKFKQEKLKKKNNQKIINKWFALNNNTFCYFNILDLEKKEGAGLIIIYLNSNFSTEKIISSQNFKINKNNKNLILKKSYVITQKNNEQIIVENQKIYLPSFFTQIKMFNEQNSLKHISKTLIYSKNIIPDKSWNELFHNFLKRILFYFQFILYPLLTLCLFFIPFRINRYKYLLILLPYPTLTLLTAISDFIVQNGFSVWFSISPYLILLITIIFLLKNIIKNTIQST